MMDRIDKLHQSFYQKRQVERNDTRQAIQHHDPDYYKKKDQDHEREETKDPYDDLNNVSVSALIEFLNNLVETKKKYENQVSASNNGEESSLDNDRHSDDDNHPSSADLYRTRAVNAYQQRSKTTGAGRMSAPLDTKQGQSETALDKAALELDMVEIMATLRGLHDLESKGVMTLSLSRGESFLKTIQNAVAQA